MRRLFVVADLALVREQGQDGEAALHQLITALGRAWAVVHGRRQEAGAARDAASWGYWLFDSGCADLLLKARLSKAAHALSECRGQSGAVCVCL